MELKDLILQALDEVGKEESQPNQENIQQTQPSHKPHKPQSHSLDSHQNITQSQTMQKPLSSNPAINKDTIKFLENLREKLLVLFEGLQMPDIKDSQAKLNLVINFLQYELCLLDDFLKQHKND